MSQKQLLFYKEFISLHLIYAQICYRTTYYLKLLCQVLLSQKTFTSNQLLASIDMKIQQNHTRLAKCPKNCVPSLFVPDSHERFAECPFIVFLSQETHCMIIQLKVDLASCWFNFFFMKLTKCPKNCVPGHRSFCRNNCLWSFLWVVKC